MKGFKAVNAYVGRNPVRTVFSIISVALRARKADAVLAYSEYGPSVTYSYIVSRIARRPLLIIIHLLQEGLRDRGFFMERAFRYCSGILCLDNEDMLRELAGIFPDKSILPVTNGVAWEHLTHQVEGPFHGIDCLYVDVLSERKGEALLLQAWSRISRQMPKSTLLVLAGVTAKDKIDSFKAEVDRRKVGKGVNVLGYVTETEKISAFSNSSVFVFPSNDEGFGLVIADAMAAGMPVVDLWDLPAFERFSKGTVKVPYPEEEKLGDAVVELLTNEEYRQRLGKEAAEFARANLSWNAAARLEEKALIILESETRRQ